MINNHGEHVRLTQPLSTKDPHRAVSRNTGIMTGHEVLRVLAVGDPYCKSEVGVLHDELSFLEQVLHCLLGV